MNVQSSIARPAQSQLRVIDCDIHPMLRSPNDILPYLPERWREHAATYGNFYRQPFLGSGLYPKATPALSRRDAWPASGGPPGSDLDFMREQHLDPNGIEFGILQLLSPAGKDQRNPDYGAVLCQATNDWQLAEWAEREPRLKASILVACEDAAAAVAEIERRASDKHFAQILLTHRTREILGQRRYWPIYEAAARNNIPVGIHVGGISGYPLAAGGWPSFYLEDHYDHTIGMQSLLASFIFEGVFEAFPDLKLIMVESGFGWAPAFTWRMDKHWVRLRSEVPHVKRAPSEYMKRNVWFTTQPIEEPEGRGDMLDLLEWVGYDRILFSTDYPHWDFDDPRFAFKANLSEANKRLIFSENARHVFGLA